MRKICLSYANRSLQLFIYGLCLLSLPIYGQDPVILDCIIEPNIVVEASSPKTGVIELVNVDRGDYVELGQSLAVMESSVEQATVAYARARAEMNSDVDAKKTNLDYAKRKLVRLRKLFKKGLIPNEELDDVQTSVNLATKALHKAEDDKRLAKLELNRALATLENKTIRSPISGIVVHRYKSPGESVENEPIVRVAQIDPLRIEAVAPAALLGIVEKGMQGRISPELAGQKLYPAEITVVDQIVDAASGTFRIRLKLPNPGHKITAGLECKAYLQTPTHDIGSSTISPSSKTLAKRQIKAQSNP